MPLFLLQCVNKFIILLLNGQFDRLTGSYFIFQESLNIGSAHNRTARPFPGFGGGAAQTPPQPTYSAPPTSSYSAAPQPGGYDAPPQPTEPQSAYNTPGAPPMGSYNAAPQPASYDTPPPPPSYGVIPTGDPTVKAVAHAQYNSPMHMYSGDNIADTYVKQAQYLNQTMDK